MLGEAWYWMAWVIWLACFALSLFRAPWHLLKDAERLNVWLGMVVLLTLMWSMQAGVKPGLSLHLLGATVFTLCFGPALAFIGLCLVLAGVTLNGAAGPMAYALNGLLMAGVGVLVSQALYRLLAGVLPKNFFVFIFVNGFFSAALMVVCVGLVSTVFLAVADAYSWEYLTSEYFPYFMLLGFSEAWLSGMVLTLFVVYRPNWVITFDDSRYLVNK